MDYAQIYLLACMSMYTKVSGLYSIFLFDNNDKENETDN